MPAAAWVTLAITALIIAAAALGLLRVIGHLMAVRQTLGTLPVAGWQTFSPTDHRVVTRVADQATVDVLIDSLRRAGVSIVGLTRRRVSLEDAYLEIVAEKVE